MSTLGYNDLPSQFPPSPLEDSEHLPDLPMPGALPDDYKPPTIEHDPHAYIIDDLDRMPPAPG